MRACMCVLVWWWSQYFFWGGRGGSCSPASYIVTGPRSPELQGRSFAPSLLHTFMH